MDIKNSIYIKGVHEVEFEPFTLADVEFKLIFNDMIVTMPGTFKDSQGDTLIDNSDGTLFRLFRLKEGVIGVTMFVKGMLMNKPTQYAYLTSIELDAEGMAFRDFAPRFRKPLEQNRQTIQDVLLQVIHVTAQFEPKIITAVPNRTFFRKLSSEARATYVEYALDISKPKKHYVVKTHGGAGIKKAEHVRRGHWRTSKLGKRYFVSSTTVNEGAMRKVVKDYQV